jgi:hypothetical protein
MSIENHLISGMIELLSTYSVTLLLGSAGRHRRNDEHCAVSFCRFMHMFVPKIPISNFEVMFINKRENS